MFISVYSGHSLELLGYMHFYRLVNCVVMTVYLSNSWISSTFLLVIASGQFEVVLLQYTNEPVCLFLLLGYAEMVPESQIDIVSALCGSSVGWFYMMIEALSDGAVKVGLPRQSATKLAAHSMVGAGKMVLETGMHPGEVCSFY